MLNGLLNYCFSIGSLFDISLSSPSVIVHASYSPTPRGKSFPSLPPIPFPSEHPLPATFFHLPYIHPQPRETLMFATSSKSILPSPPSNSIPTLPPFHPGFTCHQVLHVFQCIPDAMYSSRRAHDIRRRSLRGKKNKTPKYKHIYLYWGEGCACCSVMFRRQNVDWPDLARYLRHTCVFPSDFWASPIKPPHACAERGEGRADDDDGGRIIWSSLDFLNQYHRM